MGPLGWTHTLFAVAALAAGLVVLRMPKGTAAHRKAGWIYVASMAGLIVTAFSITRLFGGFGPFHFAAVVSTVTLVGGLVPVLRRRPRNWVEHHYFWMAYSYLGLVAALVAETAVRVPIVGLKTTGFWITVGAASFAVFAVGSTLIKRRAQAMVASMQRGTSS